VVGPSPTPDLRRALDHYGAIRTELERRQQLETAGRLSEIAELNRTIQREQEDDAFARRKRKAGDRRGAWRPFTSARKAGAGSLDSAKDRACR